MNAWETPLVLFTVFTQWAVGIALMLTIIEFCLPKLIEGEKIKAVKLGGILVLPLIAIGLICSVFHLG